MDKNKQQHKKNATTTATSTNKTYLHFKEKTQTVRRDSQAFYLVHTVHTTGIL